MPGQYLPFEHLEHTADIQIRAYGKTIGELYVNSALGMMTFIYGEQALKQAATHWQELALEATDQEALLVDWLSELLRISAEHYSACVTYDIGKITERAIAARLGFRRADAIADIKAVTYHDLMFEKHGDVWQVTVTYDI